jgi:hypothetical protein
LIGVIEPRSYSLRQEDAQTGEVEIRVGRRALARDSASRFEILLR